MVLLRCFSVTLLQWCFLACLLCLSLGLGNQAPSCDPHDLSALKEFAGNLTSGSITTAWSNDTVCCNWLGVVCDNVTGGGGTVASRVTKLILPQMGLNGKISPSLGQLDQLNVLNLSFNHLKGGFPVEFSKLKQLKFLDVSHNMLSGPVAEALSGLQSIEVLNISSNSLSGVLFPFGEFPHLLALNVSNNSFTGSFNSQVCSSSKGLHTLDLSTNHFAGGLEGLDNCTTSLQQLHLDRNSFSGPLPDSLYSMSALEELSFSANNLSGQLSKQLSKLSNLKKLVVSGNRFSGEIPNVFGNLLQLQELEARANSFSGPLPSSLALCSKLRVLNLRNNSLSGPIDLNFTGLSSLQTLDLATNHFIGHLPTSLSYCRELKVLNLARNGLTGHIPSWLSNCRKLAVLDLSWNHLNGSIPSWIGQMDNLFYLDFSNNSLTGEIPKSLTELKGLMCPNCSRENLAAFAFIPLFVKRNTSVNGLQYNQASSFPPSIYLSNNILSGNIWPEIDCKDLTVADLLKSTNNFNQANIIGCGGFGLVYKACLPNGTKAAIKRLSGDCGQMEREFQAEVEALSRAQHKNLVSLKGYCRHGNDRLLIYSYLENGSLDYWLHECVDENSALKWDARLKIAQGAARGLAYLHKGCEPYIVHRDVKSSNILLDDKFEAHLADFGLSRLLQPYDTHVTTDLVGTLGYIPPEYSQTLTATFRGDVYSFGVVLLELLTGRRPVEVIKGKNCRNLVSWVFQMKSENKEQEIFDPAIWLKDHEKQLLEVLAIACKCLDQDPRQRPSIEAVVSWLDSVRFDGPQQCS
uniref:non-specific serine/threonine protein kinase n=1 Tax=Cajanus cajan TaxID=3821 RepID=A0A151RV71_CAJCA|nr:Phytosulfokine receptor 2 [Cajanus cajan]